jgi:hypothetical protein
MTSKLVKSRKGQKKMAKDETPAVEMKMTPDEFAELRAQATAASQNDFHLGRVLDLLILHLGHSHGLDPVAEDARLKAEAQVKAREDEDARLKAEAEALVEARTAEDAQPHDPLQLEALKAARAAQDVQIQADADALVEARKEEDAKAEDAAKAEEETAKVPAVTPAQEGN